MVLMSPALMSFGFLGFGVGRDSSSAGILLPELPPYIMVASSMTIRRAMGRTALQLYPPGTVQPSTEGSGRSVSRSTPITLRMVLIAATPSQPARSAASAGASMWVMFGVIFAHTGIVATSLTQPHTSSSRSGSWPMAAPMRRSGSPTRRHRRPRPDSARRSPARRPCGTPP